MGLSQPKAAFWPEIDFGGFEKSDCGFGLVGFEKSPRVEEAFVNGAAGFSKARLMFLEFHEGDLREAVIQSLARVFERAGQGKRCGSKNRGSSEEIHAFRYFER